MHQPFVVHSSRPSEAVHKALALNGIPGEIPAGAFPRRWIERAV